MKKFILLFASVASLFSGCSEYIVGYDASTIEHLSRINYTSLTKIDVDLFCCDAELIGHTWKDGVGTLYFNEDITVVRDWAFSSCDSLTSITIPDSVTSIEEYAFYYCSSLTSVTIGNGVTSIGRGAFAGCSSLTSITIPESVTSIGGFAFNGCSSLTSITIPDSVKSIGSQAFWSCMALSKVYCKPITPPTGGSYMFSYMYTEYIVDYITPIGCKIYVPSNSVSAYKFASGWSDYKNYIVGYDF